MKITSIDIIRVAIPFETGGPRNGLRPGLAPWLAMESLIIKVTAADGAVGWGEAFGHFVCPGTYAVLETMVAPWFINQDSTSVATLMDKANRTFFSSGRNGPVRFALSAFDIAVWDMAGQRAGLPLFQLLGGASPKVGLYASLMRYGGDIDAVMRNTAEAAAAGFAIVKLHESTMPAFKAAREAAGNQAKIALDVNCPWTLDEALAIADQLRADGYAWLEEPIWPPEDFAALARLRAAGVPIAAGENIASHHDYLRLFEAGAVDIVQPAATKAGGITGLLDVFALARRFPVQVVPHCFYWGPGYLATAHVIAAQPDPPLLEVPYIKLHAQPYASLVTDQGEMTLSASLPGLGFVPDLDVFERFTLNQTRVH